MSKYGWETGEIVIPSAEWPKFKETLRTKFNREQEALLALATKLHVELLTAGKGKRNFDFRRELETRLERAQNQGGQALYSYLAPRWAPDEESCFRLKSLLLTTEGKPRRPQKKDFPLATGKTRSFAAGEGRIGLSDDKDRTLHWRVPENNHAVENARGSVMGRELFAALNKITWTRGSGGNFVGNDEYNRDSDYENGGGNYISASFGPETKDRKNLFRPGRR